MSHNCLVNEVMGEQAPENICANSEPKIGMEFNTDEEARLFYNAYARKKGFSTRKCWSSKTKDGTINYRKFCCYKEGKREVDRRYDVIKNPRPETRTGCLAHMKITRRSNTKFVVSSFEAAHNHECASEENVHMLRSHRKVNSVQATQAELAYHAGFASKAMFELQSEQASGRSFVDFISSNAKNYLGRKREREMEKGVAGAIMEYFANMQARDPLFTYSIQLDEEEQITNIFWADGRSRLDYASFGDVVTFDTTWRTNNYDRPFAPFLGVNHHNQIIVFGAALLYDEKVDSFVWLFDKFINAMNGKRPITILTDQSAEIAKAITIVLPETHQRLCVWHISQNAPKHLSQIYVGSHAFAAEFERCIYEFEEEEEFFQAWKNMLQTYELQENGWLQELFKERKQWALVYGRHIFCGDMMNTQRSDNFNSVLSKYMTSKLDPMRFFKQFESILDSRRYEEQKRDFKMMDSFIKLDDPPPPILKQTSNCYTPTIFKKFKYEHSRSLCTVVEMISEVDNVKNYTAVCYGISRHVCHVSFDKANMDINCSCKKFEFTGIPCAHMLRVLDVNQILCLPKKFILKRWTKEAKLVERSTFSSTMADEDPSIVRGKRYMDLCHRLMKIASEAAECGEAYEYVVNESVVVAERVKSIVQKWRCGNSSNGEESMPCNETMVENDSTLNASAKGHGKEI